MSSTTGTFRRSSANSQPTDTTPTTDVSTATTPLTYGSLSATGKTKKECFTFEPQQWRKTVCKNCFRTQQEHKQPGGKEDSFGCPAITLRRTENVLTTPPITTTQQPQSVESACCVGDIKSTRDNGRGSSGAASNAARAAARKLAAGHRNIEETRPHVNTHPEPRRSGVTAIAAGNATAQGIYSSASSIDARYIEELENDFFALEDKHEAVLRERDELSAQLEAKIRTVVELQATLEQYREKVTMLERRCTHMEEEIKGYRERLRLPESDQSPPETCERTVLEAQSGSPSFAASLGDATCGNELQQRLNEVEQLCQEVMEENEQLKEEVEEMQREIEEMHDHFQEDDHDAMRELQRELEAANKTCRILQFKLRKAERRFEQCEAERANLEERLARLEAELYSEADVAHIRNLEEEIRVAKEVGVRLNNELDMLDEKRLFHEEESRQLKEELQASHASRIAAENELGRLKLEFERVKMEKGILDKGPLQVTDKNRSRQTAARPSLSREASFEEQQLQRELDATRERETDLSEQLRFADEENRKLKRRIKEAQAENDFLSKKLDRMFAMQMGQTPKCEQMPAKPGDVKDPQLHEGSTGINASKAFNSQLESELSMTQRQLNIVEEENINLRKKMIGYEKDMNISSSQTQRPHARFLRSTHPEAPELEHLRNQLNLIQDHLARIEQERDRLEGENRRLRYAPASGAEDDQVSSENSMLKQQLREWEKKLRQVCREVSLVSSTERDREWLEKYNESREIVKDQDIQLNRMKKRISELQDENSRLRAVERKVEQRSRRERNVSTTNFNREALAQEIKSIEGELDDVTADLTAAREQLCTAQLRVTYLEDNNTELRAEAERRERDLVTQLVHLDSKNQIVLRLLALMHERTECAQSEIDRLTGTSQSDDCMMMSAESQVSGVSAVSTVSDEVFDEQLENGKTTGDNVVGYLRQRITNLERLLAEERRHAELAEKQLERSMKSSSGLLEGAENQIRLRQIELLKKELEEKDEILEARESQVTDLKSRIEQSRKMNDALRALMEKDPSTERSNAQQTELQVEVASYRKEIESARKEMQILRNNLTQAEKTRERLMKDNLEFQEELKLREDSIFEQDDEIKKRNAELRAVKLTMESLHKELDQTRRDLSEAKARESSGSSGRLSAQIAQNERIRAELHETMRELNDTKVKYEESKRALLGSEDKYTQLSVDLSQLRSSFQEKDAIIIDLNKQLQLSTEQASLWKSDEQTIRTEKTDLERQLAEVQNALHKKEQECILLQARLTEMKTLGGDFGLASSHDSGIGQSDGSRSREGTLSRRSAEVDRLRRELSMIRTEREELLAEVKRLRQRLEKRASVDEQGKKSGEVDLIGLPKGNAYAKALAAQQNTTKISLLNEHIAYLNRVNVELKLQNESLQNNVIDYQRRYRSLKEQYEGEQEAWLTERVVLESKAKEQEDRKVTIANTRKLLQETTRKLYELESSFEQRHQKLQVEYDELEKEKKNLELKFVQLEEHQKLPKVLQRFGSTGTASRPGVLAAQSRSNAAEVAEVTRRLESAERTVAKLRTELCEVKSHRTTEHLEALYEAEAARRAAEQEAEDLRDRLVTMECYRQQVELFRHRQFETEENAEKEFKIWQEEREHLLYRTEEARVMLEQWFTQLQSWVNCATERSDDGINEILKQMEKWRASRGKVPCLKRRMLDSLYSFDGNNTAGSVPSSPATALWRTNPTGLLTLSTLSGLRSHAQRSTSMEWGSGRSGGLAATPTAMAYRESSLGVSTSVGGAANLRGSAASLAMGASVGGGSNYSLMLASRCGRSVSPEVSVRKLSNYPDPTPGFLVRPTSRQGSHDSISSVGDYTQRAFTLPGKPPIRSAVSPARRKFFEDNSVPVPCTNGYSAPLSSLPPTPASVHPSGDNKPQATESGKTTKTSQDDREALNARKSASQPPPQKSVMDGAQSVEPKTPSNPLSITNRFVKWSSSTGSQASSKSTIDGNSGMLENSKRSNQKSENESKTKHRGKSPKSSSESREKSRKKSVEPSDSKSRDHDSQSGEGNKTESASLAGRTVKRSGSVSNISPAIMALRQKFIGASKS